MGIKQDLRKQAEAHNHWINSLTEDERKEWDRQGAEFAKWADNELAGRTERIDRFVKELSEAPAIVPVMDIPGLFDDMNAMDLINGVRRFLNSMAKSEVSVKRPKLTAKGSVLKVIPPKLTAKSCYAKAYTTVMAASLGKKPSVRDVLSELDHMTSLTKDLNWPIDSINIEDKKIQLDNDNIIGNKAIEAWHTKLNKKNYPT